MVLGTLRGLEDERSCTRMTAKLVTKGGFRVQARSFSCVYMYIDIWVYSMYHIMYIYIYHEIMDIFCTCFTYTYTHIYIYMMCIMTTKGLYVQGWYKVDIRQA